MKTLKIITLFVILVSCSEKNAETTRTLAFLQEYQIETKKTAVVMVNPNFCGACTQETVNWLIGFDKQFKGKKYILKTAEIDSALNSQLAHTNYYQLLVPEERLQRLGFGGAVSTLLMIADNELIEEKVIKGLPM
jgi:hypothetical protein